MADAKALVLLEPIVNISALDELWSLRNVPRAFLTLNNSTFKTFGWNLNVTNLTGLSLSDSFVNLIDNKFARVRIVATDGTPTSATEPPTAASSLAPQLNTSSLLPSLAGGQRDADVWRTFAFAVAGGSGFVVVLLSIIWWFHNRKLSKSPAIILTEVEIPSLAAKGGHAHVAPAQHAKAPSPPDRMNYPYFGAGLAAGSGTHGVTRAQNEKRTFYEDGHSNENRTTILPEDSMSRVGSPPPPWSPGYGFKQPINIHGSANHPKLSVSKANDRVSELSSFQLPTKEELRKAGLRITMDGDLSARETQLSDDKGVFRKGGIGFF